MIQGAALNRRVSVDPRSDRILNSGAIGKTVNSCMVARDTRYLPFPKEGIEAFKRRTLDTTRHLTCSGAHSRKPLSWVSYLFSLSVSHPRHTVSFYPSSSAPATTLPLFGLPSSLFSLLSLACRDLLVIQNLRTLVALPAYSHTRAFARRWNCFTFKSALGGGIHRLQRGEPALRHSGALRNAIPPPLAPRDGGFRIDAVTSQGLQQNWPIRYIRYAFDDSRL